MFDSHFFVFIGLTKYILDDNGNTLVYFRQSCKYVIEICSEIPSRISETHLLDRSP